MVKQGKVALLKYVILGRTEIWPLIFLSLVWCACPSEAQDPKETLARLAEAYQGHFSSIAFHETNVQRIVSEDLTRSRVISDITTNEVDVKVSNGTAIVTHQTYIGPDSSGELVESRTQRAYSDGESGSGTFSRANVFRALLLTPPGFEGVSLASLLRSENVVIERERDMLFGDEVAVVSIGETMLWIDVKQGGILRRWEQRRSGRLRMRAEIPTLMKIGDIYFPETCKYTGFNRSMDDVDGQALARVVTTTKVAADSVKINSLEAD